MSWLVDCFFDLLLDDIGLEKKNVIQQQIVRLTIFFVMVF